MVEEEGEMHEIIAYSTRDNVLSCCVIQSFTVMTDMLWSRDLNNFAVLVTPELVAGPVLWLSANVGLKQCISSLLNHVFHFFFNIHGCKT